MSQLLGVFNFESRVSVSIEETCLTVVENYKVTALETSLKFKMLVNCLVKRENNYISGVKYDLILQSFTKTLLII